MMFIVERWNAILFRFVRITILKYLSFTGLAVLLLCGSPVSAAPTRSNSLIYIEFNEKDFPLELRGLVSQIRIASGTDDKSDRDKKFAAAIDEARKIDGRVNRAITDRVWFLRGYAEYRSGKIKDSLNSFTQSLKLRPDNALSVFYQALALKDLNRCKEALPKFQEVSWLVPSMKADPLYFVAFCQEKTGKADEAQKNFILAVDSGTTYPPALKKFIEIKTNELERTPDPKVREKIQVAINAAKSRLQGETNTE